MDLFDTAADAIVAEARTVVRQWIGQHDPTLWEQFEQDVLASDPDAIMALKLATVSAMASQVSRGVVIYAGSLRRLGIVLRDCVPNSAQLICVESYGSGEYELSFAGDPPS